MNPLPPAMRVPALVLAITVAAIALVLTNKCGLRLPTDTQPGVDPKEALLLSYVIVAIVAAVAVTRWPATWSGLANYGERRKARRLSNIGALVILVMGVIGFQNFCPCSLATKVPKPWFTDTLALLHLPTNTFIALCADH